MAYGDPLTVYGKTPIATTFDTTISGSTTVTFNVATKEIQVTAVDKAILMKWGATASTSAFDAAISVGYPTTFIIPINPLTGAIFTTAQFIEATTSATLIVIEF